MAYKKRAVMFIALIMLQINSKLKETGTTVQNLEKNITQRTCKKKMAKAPIIIFKKIRT